MCDGPNRILKINSRKKQVLSLPALKVLGRMVIQQIVVINNSSPNK